jgi:hypothetical protein
VIKTKDALLPDENRLLRKVKLSGGNDTLQFGYITKKDLLARKTDEIAYFLDHQATHLPNSLKPFAFIPFEDRKPFNSSSLNDYEKIISLDSNTIHPGTYVVSFHYHYQEKTYRAVACDLIVTRANHKGSEWQYILPVRYLSGFYPGYGVFEYAIDLTAANTYEFILKGNYGGNYKISDFMLRPANTTIITSDRAKDSTFNNFPD